MDKNTTYQTGNTAATKFESLVNRLYVSLFRSQPFPLR